jgi:predicted metal-dependent HD superfamily phosphohydrolase
MMETSQECTELFRISSFLQNGNYVAIESTRIVWEIYWKQAMQCLLDNKSSAGNVDAVAQEFFDQLWDLYTNDKTRYYHTSVHIEEMLSTWKLISTSTNSYDDSHPMKKSDEENDDNNNKTTSKDSAILFAIFFHDAIYNAKSSTNEEDSVKLFHKFADAIFMDPMLKSQISNYIMATKTHQQLSNKSDPSLDFFLDLDMAVLGKNPSAYMKYAALIRKEYSFVPEKVYCEKRAEVLESFLQFPSIYRTNFMKAEVEQQCRNNIRLEIASLRKGNIPTL